MADLVIRDFYYIDTRIISSYFTQLPPNIKKRFRDEFVSTVDAVFEASLPPSVSTERSKLDVPFDETIAQLKYVEEHLKQRGDIGSIKALNTRYITGDFDLAYGLLPADYLRLFVAFPAEGQTRCNEISLKSYTILGDISMCRTRPTTMPVSAPDGSALSRLTSLWHLINKPNYIIKPDEPEIAIEKGAKEDHYVRGVGLAHAALRGVEQELSATAMRASFRGILQLRARIVDGASTHYVLYPIFLERL